MEEAEKMANLFMEEHRKVKQKIIGLTENKNSLPMTKDEVLKAVYRGRP